MSDNSDNLKAWSWSRKALLLLLFIAFMSSAWECDRQSRPRRYAANHSIPRIYVVLLVSSPTIYTTRLLPTLMVKVFTELF